MNQLRCRRTDARKRREKRLAGPRNSNSKLFVRADSNQLRILIQNPPASGRPIDPNLRHDACPTDSDLMAGAGGRIGGRPGGPARRDPPACSGCAASLRLARGRETRRCRAANESVRSGIAARVRAASGKRYLTCTAGADATADPKAEGETDRDESDVRGRGFPGASRRGTSDSAGPTRGLRRGTPPHRPGRACGHSASE